MGNMSDDFTISFSSKFSLVAFGVLVGAFIWIPIVFAAFAVGRRKVGLRFFFALTLIEAIALWTAVGHGL
jgi:hypothetical protein